MSWLTETKTEQRIYNALFVIALLALFAFKFSYLSLPYFWDELGVYSAQVDVQVKHGLSLMPGSTDPLISRGHPLLFAFLHGAVAKVFGESVMVQHVFSMVISIALLLTIYLVTAACFNHLTGLVAVVILCFQPLFLSLSGLVLPEVLMTLFVIAALSCYHKNHFGWFALLASLAILTKEGSVVVPLACICYSVLQAIILRRVPAGLKPVNFLLTVLPYLAFGIFLLLQKQQNGWYFFPYHINSMSFTIQKFGHQLGLFFNAAFWFQGRYWIKWPILAAGIYALLINRINLAAIANSFITLALIFIIGFLSFSSLSDFYMARYIFVLVALGIIILSASITTFSHNKIYVLLTTAFFCFIGFQYFEDKNFQYDADLGYRHQVIVTEKAIDYAGNNIAPYSLFFGNFPVYYALGNTYAGYLHGHQLTQLYVPNAADFYFIESNQGEMVAFDLNRYNKNQVVQFNSSFATVTIYHVKAK